MEAAREVERVEEMTETEESPEVSTGVEEVHPGARVAELLAGLRVARKEVQQVGCGVADAPAASVVDMTEEPMEGQQVAFEEGG